MQVKQTKCYVNIVQNVNKHISAASTCPAGGKIARAAKLLLPQQKCDANAASALTCFQEAAHSGMYQIFAAASDDAVLLNRKFARTLTGVMLDVMLTTVHVTHLWPVGELCH